MSDTSLSKNIALELQNSIIEFAESTTLQRLKRAKDIRRDKTFAVTQFFTIINKQPDHITVSDINTWHQWMLDEGNRKQKSNTPRRGLEESTIYTRLSHLSAYFEWLRKLPEFSHFIKANPVRLAMPKPPKKYNSAKSKALTDEELSKLWLYLEELAGDENNKTAVRDYAIFRLFMATGMRREEILGLGAGDIKFTDQGLLIHALVKGGDYEWRTITNSEVVSVLERYLSITKRKSTIGVKNRALWIRFDNGAFFANLKHRQESKVNENESEPRLSSDSFNKQIKKYAHEAGIGHFHIHQFRHTFARIVSEDSGSLIETQDALGHKDINTTREYVNRITFKKDKFSGNVSRRVQRVNSNVEEIN